MLKYFRDTTLILALFLVATTIAPAAPVEITVQGSSGYPLNLRRFTGPAAAATEATGMVDADLRQSGHFRFQVSPGNSFAAGASIGSGRFEGNISAPNGSLIFSRSYASGSLRRDAHRFADDIVAAITGTPGIASSRIAFIAKRSGKKELYICDYDGANLRQITRDASISVAPSISPDARRVAYTSYRSGYPDVYLIDIASGSRNRIVKSPGTNSGAAFSPAGDRIALSMSFSGNPELYIIDTRGGRSRRLTRSRAVDASPTWFPDGKNLVFVSNAGGNPQLYQIPARGGRARHLPVGFSYCVSPSISPDGKRLAFNARTSAGTSIAVFDIKSAKTRILPASGGAEDPCWGPDSRHLLFTRNGDLFLRNAEAIAATRIVSGMGTISEPSWSR